MKIVFATANQNKANEIQKMLPANFEILTLKDINHTTEVPETSNTIEGNAIQKANYILDAYALDCFADDTGLEVYALDGEPGVKSARYAGPQRSDADNMALLQQRLQPHANRSARFKTVICLNINGEQHLFEGIVEGKILSEPKGENGFGYDPIFEPENCGRSFAEMTMDEKNSYSHRARAVKKMIDFLHSYEK